MPSGLLQVGDVVMVDFPYHRPGNMHEQEEPRPAVVIGVPDSVGPARFGMLLVMPLTEETPQRLAWASNNPTLYPQVRAGAAGLRKPSIALVDQARAIDQRRVMRFIGTLDRADYQPIADGLRRLLAL